MVKFTASLLAKIVPSAVLKVKERKELDASLRNELTSLIFELEEESQDFLFSKQSLDHFKRKEMPKSFIPIFMEMLH